MKHKLLFLGLPLNYILLNILFSFGYGYFYGSGFFVFTIISVIIILFIGPCYKNYIHLPLTHIYLPFWIFQYGVDIPQEDKDKIDDAISSNQEVYIACPPDPLLRAALKTYIRSQLGFVHFYDSSTWDIISEPYKYAKMELSSKDTKKLIKQVGTLQSRGWSTKGKLETKPALLKYYIQHMVFHRE